MTTISSLTGKQVKGYLYSILDQRFMAVPMSDM
jgi:hypothetical protein